MTTESRMREALEQARVYIEGVAYGMSVDPTGPILSLISEALSPPARRTSYEWVDIEGFRYRVTWDSAIQCWASQVQEEDENFGDLLWVHRNGGPEPAAIATLAGLTPPEEEA